jgi:hypothetical protein
VERGASFLRSAVQSVFQYASTVNDATQPVRHHHQNRADTREEKNRRDGQLDRVGYGDVRKLKYKQMPRLD